MYHYTYIIQHKTLNKRYIGVRTSKVLPIEDTSYWGSSKYIPKDVKITHRKIILKTFKTREEAIEHEILLHELNNVSTSDEYYNKSKQTSSKFDTTGTTLTKEHKLKCSNSLKGRKMPPEYCEALGNRMRGKIVSKESREKMSKSQKLLAQASDYKNPRQGIIMEDALKKKISSKLVELGCNKSTNNNTFKPWFITKDGITTIYYDITKKEKALLDGYHINYYQDLSTKSKGINIIKRGLFKGTIVGNVPTY